MATNVDNAYFFGFIGVASALVFASTVSITRQIWELLMEVPRQESASAQWVSSSQI